jgi:sarcosine oxidase, subunit alpha
VATGRKQLVGLLTETATEVLDEGAQIVDNTTQPVPMKMLGHVTSSYMSPNCGRGIALALIADGRRRIGDRLHVTSPNGFTAVKVTEPVFFDAEGVRLHA